MAGHDASGVAKRLLEKAHERGQPLTPMQLIKLVYIAHGWMLGLYSRPLINEPVEAWRYGPVVRSVYDQVKCYRSSPVEAIAAKPAELNDYEDDLLDQVLEIYGDKSGLLLSTITHQSGTPWFITWHSQGMNGSISNDLIEAHFEELYRRHKEEAEDQAGSDG
ncbi:MULTISPECIES: Panacea domain-containing protein [Halorhodospira]|uniref:Panacea domain-containing protein n=1 Tax=Halorhodospira TaxID=85108 RepID=UPI001EE8FCCC|nr:MULTISPECIES: type II toxin-antitoxin system antitoxin SocA domain-containing protein [Halorhodospira]MCG5526891.1 DUF4065 domain-containing protein [Halorhodospira halophila]MCG5542772.1 DUF4065 domain-containing protein [Halorhodospira sp. 9628]